MEKDIQGGKIVGAHLRTGSGTAPPLTLLPSQYQVSPPTPPEDRQKETGRKGEDRGETVAQRGLIFHSSSEKETGEGGWGGGERWDFNLWMFWVFFCGLTLQLCKLWTKITATSLSEREKGTDAQTVTSLYMQRPMRKQRSLLCEWIAKRSEHLTDAHGHTAGTPHVHVCVCAPSPHAWTTLDYVRTDSETVDWRLQIENSPEPVNSKYLLKPWQLLSFLNNFGHTADCGYLHLMTDSLSKI